MEDKAAHEAYGAREPAAGSEGLKPLRVNPHCEYFLRFSLAKIASRKTQKTATARQRAIYCCSFLRPATIEPGKARKIFLNLYHVPLASA